MSNPTNKSKSDLKKVSGAGALGLDQDLSDGTGGAKNPEIGGQTGPSGIGGTAPSATLKPGAEGVSDLINKVSGAGALVLDQDLSDSQNPTSPGVIGKPGNDGGTVKGLQSISDDLSKVAGAGALVLDQDLSDSQNPTSPGVIGKPGSVGPTVKGLQTISDDLGKIAGGGALELDQDFSSGGTDDVGMVGKSGGYCGNPPKPLVGGSGSKIVGISDLGSISGAGPLAGETPTNRLPPNQSKTVDPAKIDLLKDGLDS